MKDLLKRFAPDLMLKYYHRVLAFLGAFFYGLPSERLIVIGVTGTNGKSTVVSLIAEILRSAGYQVGFSSTIAFSDGGKPVLNRLKMTMPGRFFLQRLLRKMVRNGCRYAVLESTSEGVLQFRHLHIHYDVLVFTNLAPEHLERHGGFEQYKQAKLEYFRYLEQLPNKLLDKQRVDKVIVANLDDPHGREFLNFRVDQKIGFSFSRAPEGQNRDIMVLSASEVKVLPRTSRFQVGGVQFVLFLPGRFNVENALAAIAAAKSQAVPLGLCQRALAMVELVPGRMESIMEGQTFGALVDYAPEPNALRALYETLATWPKDRIIHVLGSTGGGRDKARRTVLGSLAGKIADIVVVTNEDPYDDDPREIIEQVARGAEQAGKRVNQSLYKILDRRQAIRKALSLARANDLVLVTGKGAEQAIVTAGGRKIPWDDRQVVREELRKLLAKKTD
ncbi:MAG: UDP-N-acetylmuramyl-tripeptide synthetase [Candidatus Doudnabacteria bacterium]|nr:UDP-N-acetylmuramyl-tripeptide synthetase [Candidatus Doudnabacteria bacterium]